METPPWCERGMVGFDTETTGTCVDTDRIVTANLTYHHPQQEIRVRNFLFNPGIDIPEEASAVHGITTAHAVEHGQDPREGLAELRELLEDCKSLPLVGYNISYDLTILDRELRRHGLPAFEPGVVIDAFVIDKHLAPYRRGRRNLSRACEVYGVTLDNAHSADADALAAVLVAREQGRTGKLTSDLVELHHRQITWRAEQQNSFAQYLISQGKEPDCPPEWPIIPVCEPALV